MKRIYLNTPIASLDSRQIKRIGRMAVTWCKRNMGVNNRKKFDPAAYFTCWDEDAKVCGEYDDELNEVYIYYRNLKDVRELIATLIHEWQHQLQPLRTQYYKYKGPYHMNPFEREARKAEKTLLTPLWDALKPKVNRK